MSHYTNHAIEFQDTADASATILGSLSQVATPIESDVQYSETSGTYYPEHVSVAAVMPKFSASSFDIKKCIDYFGVVGKMIEEDTGKVGTAIYQAYYNDAAISAGATHRRLRMAKAFVKLGTVSVGHRSDAQVSLEGTGLYDETNAPVLIEASQSLPTLPASSGRWTIASVSIGGIAVNCNLSLDIDFGISETAFGCDSNTFDTMLNLSSVQPKVTFTSLDIEGFADAKVPLLGLAGTHANTIIKLRKRAHGTAGFVADGTAEHITLTADGVLLATEAHSASGNQQAQASFEMHCKWDGTNAPFIFDTAATLS